jgi:hypothetical protein
LIRAAVDALMLPACSERVAPLIAMRWCVASLTGKLFPGPANSPAGIALRRPAVSFATVCLQVVGQGAQHLGPFFQLADRQVAMPAQEAPEPAGDVVVIQVHLGVGRPARRADRGWFDIRPQLAPQRAPAAPSYRLRLVPAAHQ